MRADRIPRSPERRLELLRDQFAELDDACQSFDAGVTRKYRVVATHLRTLLHLRRPNSVALLEQVGVREKLWVFDTAGTLITGDAASVMGLVGVNVDREERTVRFIPKLGRDLTGRPYEWFAVQATLFKGPEIRSAGLLAPFERWWTDPVMVDAEGRKFTRKSLVLSVATTDGGAHVDEGLEPDYHALTAENSMRLFADLSGNERGQLALSFGWSEEQDRFTIPAGSPVPAAIRQIAWELLWTIEHARPDLLPQS